MGCLLSTHLHATEIMLAEKPIHLGSGTIPPHAVVKISLIPIGNLYPHEFTCKLSNPNEDPAIDWIPVRFGLDGIHYNSYDLTLNGEPLSPWGSGSLTLAENIFFSGVIYVEQWGSLTIHNVTNTDIAVKYTCDAVPVKVGT